MAAQMPLAMQVLDKTGTVHRVSVDERLGAELDGAEKAPAVLVTRNAAFIDDMELAAVHPKDVVAVVQGDWENALLIVVPEGQQGKSTSDGQQTKSKSRSGDQRFLEDATNRSQSPELAELAARTVEAIRAAGVDGELVPKGDGRWVNSPLNSFTLKVQPRVGKIQFTLFGNPDSYDAGQFLLADQNSFSRGWVLSAGDIQRLATLAREAHSRRQ
jgi:hypothetical protein